MWPKETFICMWYVIILQDHRYLEPPILGAQRRFRVKCQRIPQHTQMRIKKPMWYPRDRSPEKPLSTNQLRGPRRGFVSGTNKRPRVITIKTTHLKLSCHQRPWHVPPKNVTMSSKDLAPHQGPDPTKTIRTSSPHNKHSHDVCPCNGPGLSSHSPQSGTQPVTLLWFITT